MQRLVLYNTLLIAVFFSYSCRQYPAPGKLSCQNSPVNVDLSGNRGIKNINQGFWSLKDNKI